MPRAIIVANCPIADRDHKKSLRQYAHTFHKIGFVCVSKEIWPLPELHLYGILAHEIGHLLAGQDASEEDADAAVEIELGLTIRYADGKHGRRLQFLDEFDLEKWRQLGFRLARPRLELRVAHLTLELPDSLLHRMRHLSRPVP
jgi:hypothetical protein